MKKTKLLILLFPFFFLSLSGQQRERSPDPENLNILSWNIYMLPPLIFHKTGKRKRAQLIAKEMISSPYQVVVFQEAFPAFVRRLIGRKVKDYYPCRIGPGNQVVGSPKTNSGIWIISRIPLEKLDEVKFQDCHGFADCMARKGGLLVKGNWNGQEFQILGTHLQAGGPQSVRESQFHDLDNELISKYSEEMVPQFICGDMNTRKSNAKHYSNMLSILDAEDGELSGKTRVTSDHKSNDLNSYNGEENVIDFIFYKGNGITPLETTRTVPLYKTQWRKENKDLSDHYPVSISVKFGDK